ncbi:MAG: NAD(P)H-hydrate dehydratase [Bacteroidota bacterium]|nr:NAD(P)H-hydrate dehydratase [Bacteroidota bacterium]
MKILNASQIKKWDEYTITNTPISSIDLMERASKACTQAILEMFPYKDVNFQILCGKGNNGGDGLAISRILIEEGYRVQTLIIDYTTNSTKDFDLNLDKLKRNNHSNITICKSISEVILNEDAIVVDAILGSGINRPLEGLIKEVVSLINSKSNFVISIDMPTGLLEDVSSVTELAIHANQTLTFQVPKLSMFFKENYLYTGNFRVLDIGLMPEFNQQCESNYYYLSESSIKKIVKTRSKFDHKGIYGHSLLIVGSYGKMGAAVLSAKACMRSGVGKLTVACPKSGYEIIQTCVPEAMAYTIEEHEKYVTFFPKISGFESIGIGPGIEKRPVTKQMLRNLLSQKDLPPLILDADALNLMAEIMKEFPDFKIPQNAILTPHLKEFERLAGESSSAYERHLKQIAFSKTHGVIVILKGAYSGVSFPDGSYYFNSTGNPGMATAGSGDVLTGIIAGLLAQKYSLKDAALLGIFLHGLAGNMAANVKSEYALIAGDIVDYIGDAYMSLTHNFG